MLDYKILIKDTKSKIEFSKDEISNLEYICKPIEKKLEVYKKELEMNINFKLLNNPSDKKIIDNSIEKLEFFINWLNEKGENKYKNISIEIIFNNKNKKELNFKDVFINSFSQVFKNDEIGFYEITIKQRYKIDNILEINKGA